MRRAFKTRFYGLRAARLRIGKALLLERADAKPFVWARLRADELVRIARARAGQDTLPWLDDTCIVLEPYAHALLEALRAEGARSDVAALVARISELCPGAPKDALAEIAAAAIATPRRWRAAELGDRLHVRPEERIALSLRTIRPRSMGDSAFWAWRRELEKERGRRRRAEKRQRAEAGPREKSIGALADEYGVSRMTVWRWRRGDWKPGDPPPVSAAANSDVTSRVQTKRDNTISVRTGTCNTATKAAPGGPRLRARRADHPSGRPIQKPTKLAATGEAKRRGHAVIRALAIRDRAVAPIIAATTRHRQAIERLVKAAQLAGAGARIAGGPEARRTGTDHE
jgi:hypothetical protein